MNNFTELIIKEKAELKKNPNKHLPLAKRIQIAKALGNHSLINKVFLECCKFIYSKFSMEDDSIAKILNTAEDFLYENKPADFLKIYSQNKNYLSAFSEEPYSGISLACLALCSSISCDAENILEIEHYHDEDDNSFEPEEWFVDFVISNTYSGGNPFLGNGDTEKRQDFWNKYLDLATRIYQSPNFPQSPKIILNEEENYSGIINRTKNFDNEFISDILKKVIDITISDLENAEPNTNWTKIEIEGINICGIGMKAYYFDHLNVKHPYELTYYLYSNDQSSVRLMQKIKENIYHQNPKEGTWFSYKIVITADKNFSINYNFDEFKLFDGQKIDKEDFIDEFSKYPRAKQFVPVWWQNIIKNHKPNYLE